MIASPFYAASDPDRHYIWQRLIVADSDAFAAEDWSLIEPDFDADHFEGIRCHNSANPKDWEIAFPTLASYRDSWLSAAREFANKQFVGLTNRQAIYARTRLDRIDIAGDRALCHKHFLGDLKLADGSVHTGSRQTLYRLHRRGGAWRIVGFLGFLPLET
ncbi:MAG TPA: hypothetical protein VGR35_20445 [Tepidisphaeraceae bacterium]|nr:hypothetical protein [Tepidisphaeraceae bacterium]